VTSCGGSKRSSNLYSLSLLLLLKKRSLSSHFVRRLAFGTSSARVRLRARNAFFFPIQSARIPSFEPLDLLAYISSVGLLFFNISSRLHPSTPQTAATHPGCPSSPRRRRPVLSAPGGKRCWDVDSNEDCGAHVAANVNYLASEVICRCPFGSGPSQIPQTIVSGGRSHRAIICGGGSHRGCRVGDPSPSC
jgi:hypothetical protein